jgi:hypothetical protein
MFKSWEYVNLIMKKSGIGEKYILLGRGKGPKLALKRHTALTFQTKPTISLT